MTFAINQKVSVLWEDDDLFYPAKVLENHSNGKITVQYDTEVEEPDPDTVEKHLVFDRDCLQVNLHRKDKKKRIKTVRQQFKAFENKEQPNPPRLSVLWPDDGYYECVVGNIMEEEDSATGKLEFYLEYDDGDTKWVDLWQVKFNLLEVEVVTLKAKTMVKATRTKTVRGAKKKEKKEIKEDTEENEMNGHYDHVAGASFEAELDDLEEKPAKKRTISTPKRESIGSKKHKVTPKFFRASNGNGNHDVKDDDDNKDSDVKIAQIEEVKKERVTSSRKKHKKTVTTSASKVGKAASRTSTSSFTSPKKQSNIHSFFGGVSSPSATSTSGAKTTSQRSSRTRTVPGSYKEDNGATEHISTSQRSGRKRKDPVSYIEDSDDDDDFEVKPKAKTKKNRRTVKSNSESEFSDVEMNTEADKSEDDFMDVLDSSEDDVLKAKGKTKGSKATKGGRKTTSAKKDTSASTKSTGGRQKKESQGKTSMADAFTPTDLPVYWKFSRETINEKHLYLDPCGMEATDDIIGGIVGKQVEKVGLLLQRALSRAGGIEAPVGSVENILKLGTACSGTDAPSLAFGMIAEQLNLRGLKDLFGFEHMYSCENEPFKQSYIARNFDALLYPDICKLTYNNPRDVFGREKDLPDINCFIAGTSCKDFSMLMSKYRRDIEDLGTSGETFLAAVEVLFKQMPQWALFENVTGAPWEKMKEYITGRIHLKDKKGRKTVGSKSKSGTGLNSFKFEVNKEGQVYVVETPRDMGVQMQSVLNGYIRDGDSDEDMIVDLNIPKSDRKSKSFSLLDLIEANKDMASATLCFNTPVTYCCHDVKVDSKEYGVPQTRQRTYMFIWQPEDGNIHDDLGEYFEHILYFLKDPTKHSLESFLLEVDHDNIRNFREALRGPPGRETKRQVNQMGDFWTSSSANLKHNTIARERSGIDEMARYITQWKQRGEKHVPPHYWLEYVNMQHQRELDMIDILHISGVRDAESKDSNHSSFSWNISQNVSKEKHRSATPGITSCITPGGDLLLPHLGRPVLGCEKLLLQGIPYFLLSLGNETEVQLSDLAGNAMTLNVISACCIAALCCKQLQKETRESKLLGNRVKMILSKAGLPSEKEGSLTLLPASECSSASDSSDLMTKLVELSDEAVHTSIWCTCETSGQNTTSTDFTQCRICRISCCSNCCHSHSGYQLESHDTVTKTSTVESRDLSTFENKLRSVLPSTMFLKEESLQALLEKGHSFGVEARQAFSLHRIRRFRRYWIAVYYARNRLEQPIAELTIRIGEQSTQKIRNHTKEDGKIDQFGVGMFLKSFLRAREQPYEFGPLSPCAKRSFYKSNENDGNWELLEKSKPLMNIALKLVGSEAMNSYRVHVGLKDEAQKAIDEKITNHSMKDVQKHSKKPSDRRRYHYTSNWKEWPKVISVTDASIKQDLSVEESERIVLLEGEYRSAKCEHTVNQNALWIREGCDDKPTLYMLLKPDVARTGPDIGIISTSLSYEDTSHILAYLPLDWQPCDTLASTHQLVRNIQCPVWSQNSAMDCYVPNSSVTVRRDEDPNSECMLRVCGLKRAEVDMLSRGFDADDTGLIQLKLIHSQKAQQSLRAFNSICAAPILQFAAASDLKHQLSQSAEWNDISDQVQSFGQCQTTIPKRPTEEWFWDEERNVWDRRAEPEASRMYYEALENAPQVFDLTLSKEKRMLSISINPEVAGHNAARYIIEGREAAVRQNLKVEYRLSSLQGQCDPSIDRFKVKSCEKEDLVEIVPLKHPYKLYERQHKVVSKMIRIEERKTDFTEVEMSQHLMPGSMEWSLVAKVSRTAQIRGGVICDAIGAGKTVVSIALIVNGIQHAKSERPNKSKASLIVVPDGLIDQWKHEIHKFSDLKVVCIQNTNRLKERSLREIMNADCVICPIDILESAGYLENLDNMSQTKRKDSSKTKSKDEKSKLPTLPAHDGYKERTGAKGVWMTSSSNNPYGGGMSSKNQSYRNQSARYSHIYQDRIESLRQQQFGDNTRGVPLEYFEWERIFVDEIHESLITKDEVDDEKKTREETGTGFFKEKNRRAGRELLGLMTKDINKRPLVNRKGIFGLTGTPLLDNSERVIELASIMGVTYVLGLSSHWRKLEKESARDIFLHNFLEPKKSREIRDNMYKACQSYLDIACCRNKADKEMAGIKKIDITEVVHMSDEEKDLYLGSQHGIPPNQKSFGISVTDFDPTAGHDVSVFLRQNAKMASRGAALVGLCRKILEKDASTKIIVFADGSIGGGLAAKKFLNAEEDLKCTCLDQSDSVECKNTKIGWYQRADLTKEDRSRPRILVLNFDHAAGLNLQHECYNVILFNPLYIGQGAATGNAVNDASTELQAIGRVYRPGQPKEHVYVYKLDVRGPGGEECLDAQLIRRNTDKETIIAATNSSE